jgi:hypothetical protein
MKVGGGGSERYMVIIPAIVGSVIIIYALGGPNQTLIYLENLSLNLWEWARNLLR